MITEPSRGLWVKVATYTALPTIGRPTTSASARDCRCAIPHTFTIYAPVNYGLDGRYYVAFGGATVGYLSGLGLDAARGRYSARLAFVGDFEHVWRNSKWLGPHHGLPAIWTKHNRSLARGHIASPGATGQRV